MAISFPYPKLGTVRRPPGNGCLSCVHKHYCMAYFWFMRDANFYAGPNAGTQCESWSNNPADILNGRTPDDIAFNTRLNDEMVLGEYINPVASSEITKGN